MSHRRFRKMAGEVLAAVDELGLIHDCLQPPCGTLAETQALKGTAAFGAQRCGCWYRLGLSWGSPLIADRAHALNPADLFGGIRSAELKVEVISPASSLKPNHPLDKPAGFSDSCASAYILVRIIRSHHQTQRSADAALRSIAGPEHKRP